MKRDTKCFGHIINYFYSSSGSAVFFSLNQIDAEIKMTEHLNTLSLVH